MIVTARKRSLWRLSFYRCLSVHRGVSASMHAGIPSPPARHHPADTTLGRPPRADSPCADKPPTPSCEDTPSPIRSTCWDTVNKRAVRIPLECILVTYDKGNCHCQVCHFLSCWLFTKILKLASFLFLVDVERDGEKRKRRRWLIRKGEWRQI